MVCRKRIGCRTAIFQGMGLCCPAVISQRTQHRIARVRRATAAILHQITDVRTNPIRAPLRIRSHDDAIPAFAGVVGNNCVQIIQPATDKDPPTFAIRMVVADRAVDELELARDVNPTTMTMTVVVRPTALPRSPIATDRAVDGDRLTTATDMQAAAPRPALEPTLVAADRAVEQHQRPAPTLDATAVAAFQAHRRYPIRRVVAHGAIDECQVATVADAPAAVGAVVTYVAVPQRECTEVADPTAILLLHSRHPMPDRHRLEDHRGALLNKKDPVGGIIGILMRLHDRPIDSLASDSDVLLDDDAGFRVDGILKLDNRALARFGVI